MEASSSRSHTRKKRPQAKRQSSLLRPSLEEAYRSSSDSDDRDAEFIPLRDPMAREEFRDARRRHVSNSATKKFDEEKRHASGLKPTIASIKYTCWQRRKWIFIVLISLLAVLAILGLGGVWVWNTSPRDGQSPPWYPAPAGGTLESWKDSYAKAEVMVKKMSLPEKVNVTTGTGWMMQMCVGNTGPANSVGFPSLCLQDGPLGIRFADLISAFPAGITTGATWNKTLIYQRGYALGSEFRDKGVHVMLGPAMGPLGKFPAGGRNWEGFGTDPVLQGLAAAATIRGIQDAGVIATAKHFVLNEQEHFRQAFEWGLPNALSSNIDDRTLHEIYAWPFAESIKAGVGSIMCSYQMVNNSYACGNSKLMNGILKDELGFQGFIQSDWNAQRSGVASALAGLDMTMPGDGLRFADGVSYWGSKLTRAVLNSSVPLSRLNDAVTRIVAAWYQLGQDDLKKYPGPNFSSWTKEDEGLIHAGSGDKARGVVNQHKDVRGQGEKSHSIIARRVAAEGTVLVKNVDNILPLKRGGSVPDGTSKYAVGIFGEDAGPGKGPNACPDRGCNQGTLASGWGSGAVDFEYLVTPIDALSRAFDGKSVEVTAITSNQIQARSDIPSIQKQHLCIVFINSDAGEGFISSDGIRGDRNDLYPQKNGDQLVRAVATSCNGGRGNTIVVVHAVGPVILERWIDLPGVKAVVLANLPGEESGNALVDILFGDVNPSGKLPYTVAKAQDDYGPYSQVLYYPNSIVPQQNYSDGLFIDYRHFDKAKIEPRFEFGYGLSYTSFFLSNLSVTEIKPKSLLPDPRPDGLTPPIYDERIPNPQDSLFPKGFRKLHKYIYPYISSLSEVKKGRYPYPQGYDIEQTPSQAGGGPGGNPSLFDIHYNLTVTLSNMGEVIGAEVVQLYVSFPDGVKDEGDEIEFPPKVLRAFEKIEVEPGKQEVVILSLTRKDLSYWSVRKQNWVMPTEGKFDVHVGTSSRNLPLTVQL
ncbi:MAG: hypothetical protein M1814_001441 [Vezdaea aestivalis]|nr:MAG: hypothetical protein M1814_001441 [Vezdaea aestivalis]